MHLLLEQLGIWLMVGKSDWSREASEIVQVHAVGEIDQLSEVD